MSELKTKPTKQKAEDFLKSIKPEEKRKDSFEILDMMSKVSAEKGRMWGTSIVGFGMYHFKSERSSQEGDWPLIGFSPRKQSLTLYVMSDFKEKESLLKKLGKHKTSKACLYIKRLSDVDKKVLAEIIEKSFKHAQALYKI